MKKLAEQAIVNRANISEETIEKGEVFTQMEIERLDILTD